MIFIIVGVIAWLIPDVPEKVKLEIMKEILLASEAQLERKEVEEEEEEAGQEGTGEVEKKGKSFFVNCGSYKHHSVARCNVYT